MTDEVFKSDFMKGKSQETGEEQNYQLAPAAMEWQKTKLNKKKLTELDKQIAKANLGAQTMTINQKHYAQSLKIVKKIGVYCDKLEDELCYSSCLMTSHSTLGYDITGNKFGREFVKRDEYRLMRNFHFANGARDFQPPGDMKKQKRRREKQAEETNTRFAESKVS